MSGVGLVTAFGTRLHFDEATRRLVHVLPGQAPANVSAILDHDGLRLVADRVAGAVAILPAVDDGPCVLAPPDLAPRLSLAEDDEGGVRLFTDMGAVRAEADGSVRLRPGQLDAQARFGAFATDSLRCADALRQDHWVDLKAAAILPPATQEPGQPGQVQLGPHRIRIAGTACPFVVSETGAENDIYLMHATLPGGAILHLARYRPLVCFVTFGPDVYYDCLGVALQALDRHGDFSGTLCIAADRPRHALDHLIPARYAASWLHRRLPAQAGLFGRYDLPDWGLEAFQPILYLDADVVVNARIAPILTALAGSPWLHLATENRLLPHLHGRAAAAYAQEDAANWFGHWLFAHDPRLATMPFVMGSSGVIGFATTARARAAFALVRALRGCVDPAMIRAYTDQALTNYALHTMDCGEFELLDHFVDFARDEQGAGTARRGMMHFHAGVGNGQPKLSAMKRYLDRLG